MQSSCKELSIKIKNKSQLYDVLSKVYYLPELSSRAATTDYLRKYTDKEPQILMLKRKEITRHHYRYALELLELLENMLKIEKKYRTGIEAHALPNIDWLMDAILHLDPSDPHQLLQPKKEEMTTYQLEVNEELIYF